MSGFADACSLWLALPYIIVCVGRILRNMFEKMSKAGGHSCEDHIRVRSRRILLEAETTAAPAAYAARRLR